MPVISFPDLRKQLIEKKFEPIYFFHGEESYFIDQATDLIEKHALPEEQKSFNQTVIYGKDIGAEVGKVIDAAMRLPMMADRQVIIIKEAQHITGWDNLLPYINNPTQTTILVFAHKNKKIDGRSAFAKHLKQSAVLFTSKALRDYEIPAFINEFVLANGYTISPKTSQLLVEFLGTDLSKVINELEKLFIVLKTKEITPEEVERNIGISKDFNVFELQNAIMLKDSKKVFRIINYFSHNPKAGNIVYVVTMLASTFSKLFILKQLPNQNERDLAKAIGVPPFFFKTYKQALQRFSEDQIRKNIKLLHTYDLRAKGVGNVNVPPSELMRELALQLLV